MPQNTSDDKSTLVLLGTEPLNVLMLTHIYVTIWRHQAIMS